MRAHWGIEKRLHWVLDMTSRDDASRVRHDCVPANVNTLRHFTLNLLPHESSTISLKRKRFKGALDQRFCAKVVFAH